MRLHVRRPAARRALRKQNGGMLNSKYKLARRDERFVESTIFTDMAIANTSRDSVAESCSLNSLTLAANRGWIIDTKVHRICISAKSLHQAARSGHVVPSAA